MMRWAASAVPCKTVVSKSRLPGLDYTYNPYVGCTHGCLYCYVPDIMRSRGSSSTWGRSVSVKEDALRKLKADLAKLKPGVVGVSTVTDPYQPIEKRLEVTRGSLQILKSAAFPVSIQTKSSLVARDVDIMRDGSFEVGITITSRDDSFRRTFEPGASPMPERVDALRALSANGIRTWIFYGPVIPGANDRPEDLEFIAELARETRSRVLYDRLNIKPLLHNRMLTVCDAERLKQMKLHDFASFYGILESECEKKSVDCRHAFA